MNLRNKIIKGLRTDYFYNWEMGKVVLTIIKPTKITLSQNRKISDFYIYQMIA